MTLDGRWLNTMVLSKPILRATGTAARNESAESRFVPKKTAPSVAVSTS
jgi:hypothetical protein